jgi:hypothetical protein
MKTSLTLSHWLLLTYVLLTFCALGAAAFTEVAELRRAADLSTHLSAADMAAWQLAGTDNTALQLSILSGVQTVALLALVWLLPASVPRSVLWAALGCHVAVWLVSLLTRLPIDTFETDGLINLLVHSDWVRKLALLIEAPLAAYMAFRAFWPTGTGSARPTALPGRTPALG